MKYILIKMESDINTTLETLINTACNPKYNDLLENITPLIESNDLLKFLSTRTNYTDIQDLIKLNNIDVTKIASFYIFIGNVPIASEIIENMNCNIFDVLKASALKGNITFIKKYYKSEFDIEDLMLSACIYGNKEIIQYGIDYGFTDINSLTKFAIVNSQIELANWLIENGANNYKDFFEYAILMGNYNTSIWALNKFGDTIGNIGMFISMGGNLKVVEFAYDNKLCDIDDLIYGALCDDNLEIIKWLYNKKIKINLDDLALEAAIYGYLNIIEWAFENGATNYYEVYIASKNNNHINIISWSYLKNANSYRNILYYLLFSTRGTFFDRLKTVLLNR